MTANNQALRRVAAWVLTLPDPVEAHDLESALVAALREAQSSLAPHDFRDALYVCGYELKERRQGLFEVAPLDWPDVRTAA